MKFKCPNCTNNRLVLMKKEETMTKLSFDDSSTDFTYGEKEVVEVDSFDIVCCFFEPDPGKT